MNFKISSVLPNVNISNNIFNAKKIRTSAKTVGLALAASTLLTAASCSNKSQTKKGSDHIELKDTLFTEIDNKTPYKIYHFGNKIRQSVTLNEYDWAETIYPDGSSVRDSAGLKIYVSKDGKRTVEESSTDRFNNKVTTRLLPDGNRLVRKDFYLKDPNEILYTEKIYSKDNILISDKYYNKTYLGKDKNSFKIEESNEVYNNKGILLKWTTSNRDITKSDTISRYDDLGRMTYNYQENEYYIYKGDSQTPSKSYKLYKGCKSITKYDSNFKPIEKYFQASDGTITR